MLRLGDRLAGEVHAVLDRRLRRDSAAPLAVALSGGSDSRALTLLAAEWAREAGRALVVLTVDHRLNLVSAGWTADCGALAGRLGAAFRALSWDGPKPVSGLPAAARAARHGLLAHAAREVGAHVILMGHTADDVAEAAAMRREGSTTPSPREWAPSPAWPEGRGVFLLRPLLGQRRDVLRDWLMAHGEGWIEDPANKDLRFARARARAARPPLSPFTDQDMAPTPPFEADEAGVISLERAVLTDKLLAMASLCAGGGARPPRSDRLERLANLLKTDGPVVATLAGGRIEASGDRVLFMREAGELVRVGSPPLALAAGETAVWDGRFEIAARAPVTIRPLAGRAAGLNNGERAALARVPAKARGALPAVVGNDGASCPVLTPHADVAVRSLVQERLLAASGAVNREP